MDEPGAIPPRVSIVESFVMSDTFKIKERWKYRLLVEIRKVFSKYIQNKTVGRRCSNHILKSNAKDVDVFCWCIDFDYFNKIP